MSSTNSGNRIWVHWMIQKTCSATVYVLGWDSQLLRPKGICDATDQLVGFTQWLHGTKFRHPKKATKKRPLCLPSIPMQWVLKGVIPEFLIIFVGVSCDSLRRDNGNGPLIPACGDTGGVTSTRQMFGSNCLWPCQTCMSSSASFKVSSQIKMNIEVIQCEDKMRKKATNWTRMEIIYRIISCQSCHVLFPCLRVHHVSKHWTAL